MLGAIKEWMQRCENMMKKNKYEATLEVMPGRKYARIVCCYYNSRSAWAFVDMETGDIYKPAGWNAPAKHARGNIYDATQGMGQMTQYGPKYLKQ